MSDDEWEGAIIVKLPAESSAEDQLRGFPVSASGQVHIRITSPAVSVPFLRRVARAPAKGTNTRSQDKEKEKEALARRSSPKISCNRADCGCDQTRRAYLFLSCQTSASAHVD